MSEFDIQASPIPRSRDLLQYAHAPESIPSKIYESELNLGQGIFLVCDMYSDRYLVILEHDSVVPGSRTWKTISQPGEYPSGNTKQAQIEAIQYAQAHKRS
jgi:hypothetical protein